MLPYKLNALTLALAGLATLGHAADYADPTWPCVQRKVGQLSIGLMWPLPVQSQVETSDPGTQRDVAELAQTLALRRVDLEQVQPRIAAFAAKYDGDPQVLGGVFVAVFDILSTRRMRIIDGIGDFSLSQIGLAEQIETTRNDMDRLLAAAEPDFDRVDKLEEKLDWDQVIYSDRQTSIAYLCETPVLLERRLFEIARMLQELVREQG